MTSKEEFDYLWKKHYLAQIKTTIVVHTNKEYQVCWKLSSLLPEKDLVVLMEYFGRERAKKRMVHD